MNQAGRFPTTLQHRLAFAIGSLLGVHSGCGANTFPTQTRPPPESMFTSQVVRFPIPPEANLAVAPVAIGVEADWFSVKDWAMLVYARGGDVAACKGAADAWSARALPVNVLLASDRGEQWFSIPPQSPAGPWKAFTIDPLVSTSGSGGFTTVNLPFDTAETVFAAAPSATGDGGWTVLTAKRIGKRPKLRAAHRSGAGPWHTLSEDLLASIPVSSVRARLRPPRATETIPSGVIVIAHDDTTDVYWMTLDGRSSHHLVRTAVREDEIITGFDDAGSPMIAWPVPGHGLAFGRFRGAWEQGEVTASERPLEPDPAECLAHSCPYRSVELHPLATGTFDGWPAVVYQEIVREGALKCSPDPQPCDNGTMRQVCKPHYLCPPVPVKLDQVVLATLNGRTATKLSLSVGSPGRGNVRAASIAGSRVALVTQLPIALEWSTLELAPRDRRLEPVVRCAAAAAASRPPQVGAPQVEPDECWRLPAHEAFLCECERRHDTSSTCRELP